MKVLYVAAFLCLFVQPLYAQTMSGMTFQDMLQDAENDSNLQELMKENAELFDVNSDNKISYNEVVKSTAGLNEVPDSIYTDTEKAETKNYFLQAFYDNDLNHDNELTNNEKEGFAKAWQIYLLKQQFSKMDRNGDGVINNDDMPTPEEIQQQMEDAMQRAEEAVKKLEQNKPEEIAENWMKAIEAAVGDENYYQMDKDHNNCVTEAEYVANQITQEDEQISDELIKRVRDITFVEEYISLPKATLDCLTKEEYIAYESLPLEKKLNSDKTIDKETQRYYASVLFSAMDNNRDNELSIEEYVTFKIAQNDYYIKDCSTCEKVDLTEVYTHTFTEAAPTGKMNKEEFITFYIEDEDNDEIKEKPLVEIEQKHH